MGRLRVNVDGRGWQHLGQTQDRGVFPTGIAPTWSGWGSEQLSAVIMRDPNTAHPDLAAFTPLEWVPDGAGDEPAWGGYILNAPAAGANAISLNARGWHTALDDDTYLDTYVHERLEDWSDARSAPGSWLYGQSGVTGWSAGAVVQVGSGEITLGFPVGQPVNVGAGAGIYLDLGQISRGAKTVSLDYNVPAAHAGMPADNLYIRGSDDISSQHASVGFDDGVGPMAIAAGPGTRTITFTTTKRYVAIFLYATAGGTPTVDAFVQIKAIRTFTDDTYRSAGASILKATDILKYALAKVPVLDQSTSEIAQTAFLIRAFGGLRQARTARQDMERANDYHRYVLRFTARARLQFMPRLATPTLEVNTRRAGVEWNDATRDSGDDVYNKATIVGRSGSGAELTLTRTSTNVGIRNVLDRRGRTRSKTLTVNAPTDTSTMQALVDLWLSRYARTPLKGTLTLTGPEALRDLLGGRRPVPAAYAGGRVSELVLLSNLVDPDSGDRGRIAITAAGSYNEDTDQTQLAIDNTRDDVDAVLARMDVTSGA